MVTSWSASQNLYLYDVGHLPKLKNRGDSQIWVRVQKLRLACPLRHCSFLTDLNTIKRRIPLTKIRKRSW